MSENVMTYEDLRKTFEEMEAAKPDNFFPMPYPVHQTSLFPFESHYEACDIALRTEVRVFSGEWIHAAMVDGKIICSSEIYNKLIQSHEGATKRRFKS